MYQVKHLMARISYGLAIVTLLILASCQPKTERVADADTDSEADSTAAHAVTLTAEQVKRAGITLGGVSIRNMPVIVQATGMVDVPPTAMVSIHVPIAGMVKNHTMLPGAHVHKGQVLCELEHQDIIQLQQDYLENASQLTYLSSDATRQLTLLNEDAGASKKSELAASTYRMAMAKHQGLAAKLRLFGINPNTLADGNFRTSIKVISPINGYVKSVKVTQGMFVNPADILFEIVDKSHMHLELKVFEHDAATIAESQTLTFRAAATGNAPMKANIFLTGKTFDPIEKTVNIHAHINDDKDGDKLLPGMFVQAEILTSSKTATVLPLTAIAADGDMNYIFTEVLGKTADKDYAQLPIKVLKRLESEAIVILPTSLAKSQSIVLTGAAKLQAQLTLGQGEE